MEKILVVAFEFPPIRASNDRTYHFCRYLPDHGWLPIVISPRKPVGWMLYDYTMSIPKDVKVYDAPAHQNIWIARCHYLGLLPDTNLFMFTSYLSGRKILCERANEIRCIYATTPSSSALFSAYGLSAKFKKPLILDFRDPFYPPFIYKKLFRRILESADRTITTTEKYKDILVNQGADKQKIAIIPNGTDLGVVERIRRERIRRSEKFTIIYAGVLIPLYRLKAILKAVLYIKRRDVRVVIVGRVEDDREGLVEFARENGLDVEFKGRLSHEDTIRELLKATIAYNGSAHAGGLGGKIYDYLACGLPILGYNPSGSATAAFIKDYSVGFTADSEDALQENLKIFLDKSVVVERLSRKAVDTASAYDRKELTKKFAEVLRPFK